MVLGQMQYKSLYQESSCDFTAHHKIFSALQQWVRAREKQRRKLYFERWAVGQEMDRMGKRGAVKF